MPTTSTTSLYDNQNDKVFYPFTTNTAYINPYSSDRIGGELITEYNQRNALNTLCKKDMQFQDFAEQLKTKLDSLFGEETVVDPVTGRTSLVSAGLYSFLNTQYAMLSYWHATTYATGVQDDADFEMRYASGVLYVKPGKAMINGYNIESSSEVSFDINDVITAADVAEVADATHHQAGVANPIRTRFVKMVLMMVTDGTHDERLNPPVDNTYMSVAIVVNDALPTTTELLLGTITRDSNGAVFVFNNTLKTRLLPLDAVAGAEGYDELINTSDMDDGHIYGLRSDSPHHITDITSKLWLDNGSNIAKLIKAFSAEPETATPDYHKNTRGLIVTNSFHDGQGDEDWALRYSITETSEGKFPGLWWHQAYALEGNANATIERRDIYFPFAECDDDVIHKNEIKPSVTSSVSQYVYDDNRYPEIHGRTGKSGLMTPQQTYMLEKAYQHVAQPSDAGTQYGPFLSMAEALTWFSHHDSQSSDPIYFKLGDYFWIINDTIDSIQTDFGTITGQVSGSVSGTVSGTVTGTGTVEGEITETHDPVTGTVSISSDTAVTGNVSGNTQGTVMGRWDGFTQNVSIRYTCIYSGPGTAQTNRGVKYVADYAHYAGGTHEPTDVTNKRPVSGTGTAVFVRQTVERGFSIPATSSTYGLVKARGESEPGVSDILDVVVSNATGRLMVNRALYESITNGGFVSSDTTIVTLNPGDDILSLWNKRYTGESLTIQLKGAASAWEVLSDAQKTLSHVRGHIILDYSEMSVDTDYTGNIIFNLVDVDYVTLNGDNEEKTGHKPTSPLRLSFDHCIVDTAFFENIGHWKSSSFTSGSNTIELNNPWMTVDKIFLDRDYINNKLYTRFASVTMGENGISSAMMDMWIQYENTQPDANSIDHCWASRVRVNFPPLRCDLDMSDNLIVSTGNVNKATIQYIPEDVCMKIGATAGIHEVITAQNASSHVYTPSGNLLAMVDWSYNTHYDVKNSPAEQLYLNLYMKNSSGEAMQKITNLKFRVPVQVTRQTDNSSIFYATYKEMYGADPVVAE